MALFETKGSFETNGFIYKHLYNTRKGKDIFTCAPLDDSMSPQELSKKEYKAIEAQERIILSTPKTNALHNAQPRRVLIPASTPFSVFRNVLQHNARGYAAYIDSLLAQHNITAKFTLGNVGNGGWALPEIRKVCVPTPLSVEDLLICLHEIYHVLLHVKEHRPIYHEREYQCEMNAIRTAMDLGCSTEELLAYRQRARANVRACLFRYARLKSFKVENVSKEVQMFCEVDAAALVGATIRYDRGDDSLIVHQPEDCKRWTGVKEETETLTLFQCCACLRVWVKFK